MRIDGLKKELAETQAKLKNAEDALKAMPDQNGSRTTSIHPG